jgi:hypothetical protein
MQKGIAIAIIALLMAGMFVVGTEYQTVKAGATVAPVKEMVLEVTAYSTNGGFTKLLVENKTIPVATHSVQFSTDSRFVRENNITSWGISLYNV